MLHCVIAAALCSYVAAMSPTQPVFVDDDHWPPREPHDVTAQNLVWYQEPCPQKNANAAFGSETPVACPPNPLNVDTAGAPAPPPPQLVWNDRQVAAFARRVTLRHRALRYPHLHRHLQRDSDGDDDVAQSSIVVLRDLHATRRPG